MGETVREWVSPGVGRSARLCLSVDHVAHGISLSSFFHCSIQWADKALPIVFPLPNDDTEAFPLLEAHIMSASILKPLRKHSWIFFIPEQSRTLQRRTTNVEGVSLNPTMS